MHTIQKLAFLTGDEEVRDAVDYLFDLVSRRKKLEEEEKIFKDRLIEISLRRGELVISGKQFVCQIVTEFQQRINLPKLKAEINPKDLAPFTQSIKVTKVIVTPNALTMAAE